MQGVSHHRPGARSVWTVRKQNKPLTFSISLIMFPAQFTLRGEFVREIFSASFGALQKRR
jgi:hypothetical protein